MARLYQMPNKNFFSIEGVQKSTLRPREVILSLLRVKAMTQADLAREVGVSRQCINNYLSGNWGVPTKIKIKIAQVLEVDSSAIWDFPEVRA